MTLLKAIVAAYGPRPFVNAAVVLGAIAVMLIGSPPSHADPDPFIHNAALVCRMLDVDSSPAGVWAIVESMVAQGLTTEQGVATRDYALANLCPEYVDEWEAAAEAVRPERSYAV